MPKGGLLARLGGDEFGALIPGDEGLEVARALRATLSYPFEISGNGIQLGVSVGIAECTPDLPGNNLLRRADEAMYQAKRTRSGVAIWEESIMSSGL
jgi:diguanylate cyclase (GGDEF)-like protein